jgi:hypothetical protein
MSVQILEFIYLFIYLGIVTVMFMGQFSWKFWANFYRPRYSEIGNWIYIGKCFLIDFVVLYKQLGLQNIEWNI